MTGDHAFNEVFLNDVRLPADCLIGTVNDGWRLGTPDMVVTMPLPYALPAGGKDIYRNFVFPVTNAERRCNGSPS